MKYIANTIKYIQKNALTLLAFVVAAVCLAAAVDLNCVSAITESAANGKINAGITDWFLYFLPLNTSHWWTILLNLAAYIVLTLDMAMLCASADRRMRFNSSSPRGLFSAINNNLMPCAFTALVLSVSAVVSSLVLAAVMKAFCVIGTAHLYIAGIVLCAVLFAAFVYVASMFSLWLPCFTITGFRLYESFGYAFSLNAPVRKKTFISIALPVAIVAVCAVVLPVYCPDIVSMIVLPLIEAALFVYLCVDVYVIYMEADGITREDLKKF